MVGSYKDVVKNQLHCWISNAQCLNFFQFNFTCSTTQTNTCTHQVCHFTHPSSPRSQMHRPLRPLCCGALRPPPLLGGVCVKGCKT